MLADDLVPDRSNFILFSLGQFSSSYRIVVTLEWVVQPWNMLKVEAPTRALFTIESSLFDREVVFL